jgi:tRNA-dihydrouridine synthase
VQSGSFGACLMQTPEVVAQCVHRCYWEFMHEYTGL